MNLDCDVTLMLCAKHASVCRKHPHNNHLLLTFLFETSSLFPLQSAQWFAWLDDELALGQLHRSALAALFERAVNDYASPALWIRYIEFLSGVNFDVHDAAALDALHTVTSRALKQCGSDVAGGAAVWRAVQRVEIRIADELTDDASVARVRQLALERAERPLLDDDDVHREYLEWEASRADTDTAMAAIERVQERVLEAQALRDSTLAPLEAAVRDTAVSDFSRWPAWQEYLTAEQATLAAPQHRVLALFERALVPFCVFASLWTSYAAYVAAHEPAPGAIVQVYERAVRNMPWIGEMWAGLIEHNSRDDAPSATIMAIVGRAMQAGLSAPRDYVTVYFAALLALKVRVVAQLGLQYDDSVAQQQPTLLESASTSRVAEALSDAALFDETVASVRLCYEQAVGQFKEGAREVREESRNVIDWALRFEFDIVARAPDDGKRRDGALNRVRMLYGELLSLFPRTLESWMRAADFEAHIGARARARALYSTGASLLAPEHVPRIVGAWLAFEHAHGDDVSAAHARQHGSALIHQSAAARASKSSNNDSTGDNNNADAAAAAAKQKKSKRREPNAARPDKKKRARRGDGADSDAEGHDDDHDDGESPVVIKKQPKVEKSQKATVEVNAKPTDAQPEVTEQPPPPPPTTGMRPPQQTPEDAARREIVIRNMPFAMTVAQARTLLSDYGEVDAMRLLTLPDGRSRGVAFCTYVTPEMARRAKRELTDKKLDGRTLQVQWAKNDSNPIAAEHDETLTVYVSNVHVDVTEQEMRDAFAAVVAPRSVRRTVGKKFAFVEFADADAVLQALAVDGTQLHGQAIRVLRSDPSLAEKPAKPTAAAAQQPTVRKPTMQLLPRSVARASGSGPSESSADATTAPKSNADFRKFLLQK